MKNNSFCKGRKVLWYAFLLPLYLTSPEIFAKNSSLPSISLQQQQQITGIITDVVVNKKDLLCLLLLTTMANIQLVPKNTNVLVFSYYLDTGILKGRFKIDP